VADYDLPATSRHDLDNVVKIVLDALQVGGVVLNDRCIVAIDAASWFAASGKRGRVEVTLTEVTP
jgi:Holliday junction resolvase RusA-like endonuclease